MYWYSSKGWEHCGPQERPLLAALERGFGLCWAVCEEESIRQALPLHTEDTLPSLVFSEQNLERQVLQTQCRRLEARHYSLSLTAEQLSHSVAVSWEGTETFKHATF